jgi:hypothetical protein
MIQPEAVEARSALQMTNAARQRWEALPRQLPCWPQLPTTRRKATRIAREMMHACTQCHMHRCKPRRLAEERGRASTLPLQSARTSIGATSERCAS